MSEVDPQLAAVLDTLPVPVVLLDGRGRVSWGNAAGGQACGRSLDDIRGRPFWELAPAVAGGARAAVEAVLAGHGPRSIDGAREMSSRETKPLHWHLAAIANGTGEIAQVVATAREDDAPSASSRGAPEAAIEPVHSMTRYLSHISHEARTPLNAVIGFADAGVALESVCPDDLVALRGDARKLKQALINLVSNAIEFTPDGGSVDVEAGVEPGGELVISVRDTGVGMAADDIPTAMAPFGQVQSSLTRRSRGTGLGLPMVQALVELHGGVLTLASVPGSGTTVAMRFPADRVIA